MTLGIPKKYERIVLGVVGAALLYAFYTNVIEGPDVPAPAPRAASKTGVDLSSDAGTAAPSGAAPGASTQPPRVPGRGRNDTFTPVYQSKRPEDRPDPAKIDPTIHLDKLAKLQDIPAAGGRDLFNWGTTPPPAVLAGVEPKVRLHQVGPMNVRLPAAPPTPVQPAAPPPPPPIPLKYYGIATRLDNGRKTAFFMEGEEILIEAEGSTFGGRYKLVKIGVNSAVIEDTQYKRQQTLPLEEGPVGS